jgi:hypothetical protein
MTCLPRGLRQVESGLRRLGKHKMYRVLRRDMLRGMAVDVWRNAKVEVSRRNDYSNPKL